MLTTNDNERLTLREAVDLLASVRSVRFAASFLDVVPGGRHRHDEAVAP